MPQFTVIKNIEELKNETIKGVRLQDFKLEELRDLAETFDPLTTQRSRQVEGGLKPVMINKHGDLVFHTKSSNPSGPTYTQLVRFYDIYNKKIDVDELESDADLNEVMKKSEIGVWCSDPSFQYWGPANNATRAGYNIITETRRPNEPNKKRKEEFVLCKHLIAVLKYVESNWGRVAKTYWRYKYGK